METEDERRRREAEEARRGSGLSRISNLFSDIGSIFSKGFDFLINGLFLGAIGGLIYYFRGPIFNFLEPLVKKIGEWLNIDLTDGFNEVRRFVDDIPNMVRRGYSSLVGAETANRTARGYNTQQIDEEIKDLPPSLQRVVRANWTPLLNVVDTQNERGDIRTPFDPRTNGAAVLHRLVTQQPALAKQLLLAVSQPLPQNATDAQKQKAAEYLTQLRGSLAALDVAKLADVVNPLLTDPATRPTVLTIIKGAMDAAKITVDANAVSGFINAVGIANNGITPAFAGALKTMLDPSVATKDKVTAMLQLVTTAPNQQQALQAGMNLLSTMSTTDVGLQQALNNLRQDGAFKIMSTIGVPDTLALLGGTQPGQQRGFDTFLGSFAYTGVPHNRPEERASRLAAIINDVAVPHGARAPRLDTLIADDQTRALIAQQLPDLLKATSGVGFTAQAPLSDFLREAAGLNNGRVTSEFRAALAKVVDSTQSPQVRSAALISLLTAPGVQPGTRAALLNNMTVETSAPQEVKTVLSLVRDDRNQVIPQNLEAAVTLIQTLGPDKLTNLMGAMGRPQQELEEFLGKPENAAIKEALKTFAMTTGLDTNNLPADLKRGIRRLQALVRLEARGITEASLRTTFTNPTTAIGALLDPKQRDNLSQSVADLGIVLSGARVTQAEDPRGIQRAAIRFIAQENENAAEADNARYPNLAAILAFTQAVGTDARTRPVVNGLIALLTGDDAAKAANPLNPADVATFFQQSSNRDAFQALFNVLNTQALSPAQQQLIATLKDRWFTTQGGTTHGIAVALANRTIAETIIQSINAPAPANPLQAAAAAAAAAVNLAKITANSNAETAGDIVVLNAAISAVGTESAAATSR